MVPALLKGFLERVFIKGFAFDFKGKNQSSMKLLRGKTAHIIQTIATPNFVLYFLGAHHAAKALKSFLTFCGIKPVKIMYLGRARNIYEKQLKKHKKCIRALAHTIK